MALAETFVELGIDDESLEPEIRAALDAAAAVATRGGERIGREVSDGIEEGLDGGERAIRSLSSRLEGLTQNQRDILIRLDSERAQAELRSIERRLQDPTLTRAEIDVLFDQRGRLASQLSAATVNVDRFADRAVADLRRVDAQADRTGVSLLDIAAGSALGSVAVQGISAIGRGLAGIVSTGIQAAGSVEQVGVAFEGLLGSEQRGAAFLERLQQFAATTPFEFAQVTGATQALLALGKTADESIEILTTVGDAAAAVGAPGESIERVVRAITQISAKGKLSSEELNQIAEALPNLNRADIFTNLAEATGKSEAEIRKLAETGGITAEQAIPALVAALGQVPGAMGAMARQATTLNGLLSTFKDTVKIELTEGFVPLVELIRETLPELTDVVGDIIGPLGSGIASIATGLIPLGINLARSFGPALVDVVEGFGEGFERMSPFLAEAGEQLAELIRAATPLLPVFAEVAAGVGSGFLPVLRLSVPVLEAFAGLIDAIPGPVLSLATSIVVANKAFGGLAGPLGKGLDLIGRLAVPSGAVAGAFGSASKGATGLAGAFSSINPAAAAAGLALTGFALITASAAEKKRKFQEEVTQLTQALEDEAGALTITAERLATYVEESSRFETRNQIDDLSRLGITFQRVADQSLRGADGLREFLNRAIATDEISIRLANGGREIADAYELTDTQLRNLSSTGIVVNGVQQATVNGNGDLITSFLELADVTEAAARAEVEGAVAADRATKAEVERAIARNTAADGTINYVGALETLSTALNRSDRAEAAQAEKHKAEIERLGSLAEGIQSYADGVQLLRSAGDGVLSSITALTTAGGDTTDEFIAFALAAGDGALSAEQLGAASARLGVDVKVLEADIKSTNEALDKFVDSALAGLPGVGDVFSDAAQAASDAASAAAEGLTEAASARAEAVTEAAAERAEAVIAAAAEGDEAARRAASEQADSIRESAADQADAIREGAQEQADAIREGAATTVAGLTESFRNSAAEISDFGADLALIAESGFTDISELLAGQGLEAGNAIADELADALATGNRGLAEELAASMGELDSATAGVENFFRTVLGPAVISESLILGALASENFGKGLNFEDAVRLTAEVAKLELSDQGRSIALIAATEGEDAARALGESMNLTDEVINQAIRAGEALSRDTSIPVHTAGLARRSADQMRPDFAGGVGVSIAAADAALRNNTSLYLAAFAIGAGVGDGFVSGIEAKKLEAAFAAQGLVGEALIAARKLADIRSPSHLFEREIGEPIGEGIALGIANTAGLAATEVQGVIAGAADFGTGVTSQPAPTLPATAPAGPGRAVALVESQEQLVQHIYTLDPIAAANEAARKHRAARVALTRS